MAQQCEECDLAITGEALHLIFGGKMFRFCCQTHRQSYRKVLLQSVVNAQLRKNVEANNNEEV